MINLRQYLIKCFPGFNYLSPDRQAYYAESLPFAQHFHRYLYDYEALENQYRAEIPRDVEMLYDFQHRKRLRAESTREVYHVLNQEVRQREAFEMLKAFHFGNHFVPISDQMACIEAKEYKQAQQYVQTLYNELEEKYIRIIEENNAKQGWLSYCRRIPPDKILSGYKNEYHDLHKEIRGGVTVFLSSQQARAPYSGVARYARKLNRSLQSHYSMKVNKFFDFFPALINMDRASHYHLRQHFYKLFLETDREIFYEKSNLKEKNDLIIRSLANECYYLLEDFVSSLGYLTELHELNRNSAFVMASIIYKSFTEHTYTHLDNATFNSFFFKYKNEVISTILLTEKNRLFTSMHACERQLSYSYSENSMRSLNTFWSYTISSTPARLTGRVLSRFFDSIGFLQAINTGTENDIALFFVAANATRISEEVSYFKRILLAISRMVFSPIKQELYQASLEPNPTLRELKLAAVILFYTAIIAFSAFALAALGFITLFVGMEFVAVPVAIVIIFAAATLVTKVTFHIMHAYHEWKNYSINERMNDMFGRNLAEEILVLYKNTIKSVDFMVSHLSKKTGLTQQELDFKDELEKLKIDIKEEWVKIRDDKSCPISQVRKIILDRIKYIYDKEKKIFHDQFHKELHHRFDFQEKNLKDYCMQFPPRYDPHHDLDHSVYKSFSRSKNQITFFKRRVYKLKQIADHLEEKNHVRLDR